MTEKLYYTDSYTTSFTAPILRQTAFAGKTGILLPHTFFYPTSGGQEHDTGFLNGVRVLDVVETGDGIIHVTDRPVEGESVRGEIDWARRFDTMQQHTGQHILSQAFLQVLKAPTASSRLGIEHSTIDVGRLGLTWEDMQRAEEVANSVVFENRPVVIRTSAPDEAQGLRAKKALPDGMVRLVEVEGFDVVPCGGTHCRSAGEVGLIKIIDWEKVRETTRVEFVCGRLAEADYFWKNRALVDLAKGFTTGVHEVPDMVRELAQASQTLRRDLSRARARLAEYELAELEANARTVKGVKVVAAALEGLEPASLREMAARLAKKPMTVALLASRGERAHFVFARSPEVVADMRKVLAAALALVEGKGGGRAEAAEGGGKNPSRVDEALAAAVAEISFSLTDRTVPS